MQLDKVGNPKTRNGDACFESSFVVYLDHILNHNESFVSQLTHHNEGFLPTTFIENL